MSLLDKSIKRRDFLRVSAGAAAAAAAFGVAGCASSGGEAHAGYDEVAHDAQVANGEGVVVHDDSLCVLCRNCMTVCPYGAPQYDEVEKKIVKCDTCKDLRAAGEAPVCVAACPMRAIDFGDVDDLREKHGGGLVNELPYLPTASWTRPNVLYKPNAAAGRDDFAAVVL